MDSANPVQFSFLAAGRQQAAASNQNGSLSMHMMPMAGTSAFSQQHSAYPANNLRKASYRPSRGRGEQAAFMDIGNHSVSSSEGYSSTRGQFQTPQHFGGRRIAPRGFGRGTYGSFRGGHEVEVPTQRPPSIRGSSGRIAFANKSRDFRNQPPKKLNPEAAEFVVTGSYAQQDASNKEGMDSAIIQPVLNTVFSKNSSESIRTKESNSVGLKNQWTIPKAPIHNSVFSMDSEVEFVPNRFMEMRETREALREMYIKQNKMADPEARYNLGEAPEFKAECMDMCPEYERHEREYQKGLDPFERLPMTDPSEYHVDHKRAVKRYRRSAAGDPPPLPCDVRPPPVLKKTLEYLFEEIVSKNGLEASYSFVRDRARSIRNDLTLQNYRGKEAVELHERIARYHIVCAHALCEIKSVSLQQEHEQLRKTLQSLLEYYKELNSKGVCMPNEAEFQAYYILTHAWSNDVASRCEMELPERVFMDSRVQLALYIRFLMTRKNENHISGRPSVDGSPNDYARLFKIIADRRTPYLFACCIHMDFVDIRRGALKTMQHAYYFIEEDKKRGIKVDVLVNLLGFDDAQEALDTLAYYEIEVQEIESQLVAVIGKQRMLNTQGRMVMSKGKFVEGKRVSLPPRKSHRIIEVKREGFSDLDILNGRLPNLVRAGAFTVPGRGYAAVGMIANRAQAPRNANIPSKKVDVQPSAKSDPISFQLKRPVESQSLPEKSMMPTLNVAQMNPPQHLQSFTAPNQVNVPLAHIPQMNVTSSAKNIPAPSFNRLEEKPVITQTSMPIAETIPAPPLGFSNIATQPPIVEDSRTKMRKQFEVLKDEIIDTFIGEETATIANEVISYLKNVTRYGDHVMPMILDDLIDSVVHEIVQERLVAYQEIFVFREVLDNIFTEIMVEITHDFIGDFVIDILEEEQRNRSLEWFGWCRWRYVCHRENKRRQDALKRIARFQQHLSSSVLVPGISRSAGLIKKNERLSVQFAPDILTDSLSTRFRNIISNVDSYRSAWWKPLDLNKCLVDPIVQKHELCNSIKLHPLHFKLLLYVPHVGASANSGLAWFSTEWLLTKFSASRTDGQKSADVETLISVVKSVAPSSKSKNLRLLIQRILIFSDAPPSENSRSIISGVNSVIFQLDVIADDKPLQVYWQREKAKLRSFLNSLPKWANVPLLVVFWPNNKVSIATFESEAHKNLDINEHVQSKQICSASFLCINATISEFDDKTARINLQNSLADLVAKSPTEPHLSTGLLKDVVIDKLTPFLQFAATRIESSVPRYALPDPSVFQPAVCFFIDVFNMLVKTVERIIVNDDLLRIQFPALELSGKDGSPPLDWNSISKLQSYSSIAEATLISYSDVPLNAATEPSMKALIGYIAEILVQNNSSSRKDEVEHHLTSIALYQDEYSFSTMVLFAATKSFERFAVLLEEEQPYYLAEHIPNILDHFSYELRNRIQTWCNQLNLDNVRKPWESRKRVEREMTGDFPERKQRRKEVEIVQDPLKASFRTLLDAAMKDIDTSNQLLDLLN